MATELNMVIAAFSSGFGISYWEICEGERIREGSKHAKCHLVQPFINS
jgi:hypothetical protein